MRYGPVIWVEGIIGSGKSTLTKEIAEKFNLRPLFEPVETNKYLEHFYENPKRWAFSMQIELLKSRFAMQKIAAFEATMIGGYKGSVLDRGLPGDRVFCKMHVNYGNIHPMEWETYEELYNVMCCSLIPPSLLLFLDVEPEIAFERIKKRARSAEVNIDLDYLKNLRKGYMDLLVEIESGEHHWSRGIEVKKIPYNSDFQSLDKLMEFIRHRYYL